METMLELKNVRKTFNRGTINEKKALNGVNLKLGYTTPDVREALIKRVAIENTQAGGKFILADHVIIFLLNLNMPELNILEEYSRIL